MKRLLQPSSLLASLSFLNELPDALLSLMRGKTVLLPALLVTYPLLVISVLRQSNMDHYDVPNQGKRSFLSGPVRKLLMINRGDELDAIQMVHNDQGTFAWELFNRPTSSSER